MKDKEVVTKENYKQVVLKRAIILCWVLLAVCFVVKIFGGNFFNIICENERFIKVCTYIENTFWYYVISFISNCLGTLLLWLSMARQIRFSKKDFIISLTIILILYIIQCVLIQFNALLSSMLISVLKFVILPLFVFRFNWKQVLLVSLCDVLFQFMTLTIKSLSLVKVLSENVLISLIFMIDYYIMLTLCFLYFYYTNKNKEKFMGLFGSWWLHKPLAELEALLPTLKDEDERKACEKRIAKLKEKEAKKSK